MSELQPLQHLSTRHPWQQLYTRWETLIQAQAQTTLQQLRREHPELIETLHTTQEQPVVSGAPTSTTSPLAPAAKGP